MIVYVPASTGGGFQDFPRDPSARRVFDNAFVSDLSYYNNFGKDFPGIPDDNFALEATAFLAFVDDGHHQLCTRSDDGSWLYVDDSLLINNEGVHSDRNICQTIWLSKGTHTITVHFFEHFGGAILQVSMDGSTTVVGKSLGARGRGS